MSKTLAGWNTIIFLGQIILLAIVTGMTYLTHTSAQRSVIVGLICLVSVTAVIAMGAMKQERGIVYDLSIGNACGLVALFFLILAVINYGSVPANVATTCFVGGLLFLAGSVAMARSAAQDAIARKAPGTLPTLTLMAAPLGIGPIADVVIRHLAQTAKSA